MSLFELIKSDGQRHSAYGRGHWSFQYLINRSLWATFQYRIANSIYTWKGPFIIKRPFLILMVIWQYFVEWFTTIKIPYSCSIGKGFYIGHPNNIILNSKSIIGDYCNLSQGVTIGISGTKENRGVPILGDYIYVAANAVVAGKITIGDWTMIGANSVVTKPVEKNCLVFGNPMTIVPNKTSKDYILPVK